MSYNINFQISALIIVVLLLHHFVTRKKLHNANIYNTIPFNMLIKPHSDSHIKTEFKYIHLGMDVSKNAYDLLKIYFDSQNIIKQ